MSCCQNPTPETPAALAVHQPDFKPGAWLDYTLDELGHAVAFFAKRATHRAHPDKAAKDLYDARNYLAMMQAKLEALEQALAQQAPQRQGTAPKPYVAPEGLVDLG